MMRCEHTGYLYQTYCIRLWDGAFSVIVYAMSLDFALFDNDFSVIQALDMMESEHFSLSVDDLLILNSKDTLAQLEQPDSPERLTKTGSTGSMSPVSEISEDPTDDVISALETSGKLSDDLYGKLSENFSAYVFPGESHDYTQSSMTRSTQGVSYAKRATRKRSHYVDDEDDLSDSRTKAARQAKLNRERKKEYVTGLENQVKTLEENNSDLNLHVQHKDRLIADLREEVRYLRGVLANQTTLSRLLRNINFDSDEFSDDKDRRVTHSDHSGYTKAQVPTSSADVGVCLHVSSGAVSLELCRRCSERASTSTALHPGD